MDFYVLILRLLHIGAGVFWAGGMLLMRFYISPSAMAAGPAGGQFMMRLGQRGLTRAFVYAAAVTVLTGILLYWQTSGGFQTAWIVTGPGLAFTIGGLATVWAAWIGTFVSAPSLGRVVTLGQQIAAAGGPPTAEQAAEMGALQGRMGRALRDGSYLLIVAVVAMAVARNL